MDGTFNISLIKKSICQTVNISFIKMALCVVLLQVEEIFKYVHGAQKFLTKGWESKNANGQILFSSYLSSRASDH